MPGDVTTLVTAVRFHWREYWPQSLLLVPLATAILALMSAGLARATLRNPRS